MADREPPITWTDGQVRMLILMHQAQYDGLKNLLIAKGTITADELAVSIEASTNTLKAITTARSPSPAGIPRARGDHADGRDFLSTPPGHDYAIPNS